MQLYKSSAAHTQDLLKQLRLLSHITKEAHNIFSPTIFVGKLIKR